MRPRPPRRRERTRWLLVTPLLALTVVVVGTVALEAVQPQVGTAGREVTGIPPLVLDEPRPCTRQGDEDLIADLRGALGRGDRVSSAQVYACPIAFDGLELTFVGEVVGELVHRRGGAWAQVNDDAYALEVGPLVGHRQRAGFNSGLSVWLPDGLHDRVTTLGRAGTRGDVVVLRGTVVRADPRDGGGLTFRGTELELAAQGQAFETPLHVPQAIVAGLLAVLASASLVWARRVRNR